MSFGYPELNRLLLEVGLPALEDELAGRFAQYRDLLLRWNEHINLTAIRDEEGILRRHFVESIACAQLLPTGITTLLDFGSGAGFPGLPIALCRPDIRVTLAESQNRKAAFLREAVRVLRLAAAIHGGRAETLEERFNCVVLRAVDRMQEAVSSAVSLVQPEGWLVVMTTASEQAELERMTKPAIAWQSAQSIAGSTEQILLLGAARSVPRGTAPIEP